MSFNSELTDLLEMMKNIAIFQFRYLQKRRERFERFIDLLGGFFRIIDLDKVHHGFVHPATGRAAIVMITSDEGFMGDLNFKVIDMALLHSASASAEFIIVGDSGKEYLKDIGKTFTAYKSVFDAGGRSALAGELSRHIMGGITEGNFGRVIVYYPKPISFMVQKVESEEIFPLTAVFSREGGSRPGRSVIMESPVEGIIKYLAEEFIEQKLVELLEDSKLSEFAARAIHLEKSGQELVDKKKELRAHYFRAYHEFIDKNTRELFASQSIIKRKM
jgi:ATP synthase F1 gamma subunit